MNSLHDETKCSHLATLRLSDSDFASLREQGFVSSEQRGKSTFFKLRFRSRDTGRQCVRYIGKDQETATAVSRELEVLQRTVKQDRRLRRLEVEVRRVLRETKESVQRLLVDTDYHFYGMEIRSHRRTTSDDD